LTPPTDAPTLQPGGTDEQVISGLRQSQYRQRAGAVVLSEMLLPAQGAWLTALQTLAQPSLDTIDRAEQRRVSSAGLADYVSGNTQRVAPRRLAHTAQRPEPTPLFTDPRIEDYMGARWWPDRDKQTPMAEFNLRPAQLGKAEERVWIHEDWEKRKQRYSKSHSRTALGMAPLPLTGIEGAR
jgi:hypothetical protein